MSILIKGMEMPKDCRECNMLTYYTTSGCSMCDIVGNALARNFKPIPFDGRPDWCPLTEIPEPHGNLIDADEFAEGIMHEAEQYWGLLKHETREMIQSVCKDIRNYPAVIEREDGENES